MGAVKWDEDRYDAFINVIDQGFFVIDIIFDANNKPIDMYYVEANESATKMLGLDYTGKRLRDINPNYEEYWYETFGNVALTGQSIRTERHATPDKKWYSFYIFKIGDEKSRRIGNIFMDITERKKTEEALKESEQLYRTLFENTEDGFVLVQPIFDEIGNSDNYMMVDVNQAWEKQTGLKAVDLLGKTIRESLPMIESIWPLTFAGVLKSGISTHFESFNRDSNRWFDLYAFNHKKDQVGVLFQDITERKMMEEALRASEERQAFLLKLSDDLRGIDNPIEIQHVACKFIKERLDTEQSNYTECYNAEEYHQIRHGNAQKTEPKMEGTYHVQDYAASIAHLRSGRLLVVEDTLNTNVLPEDEALRWYAQKVRAQISAPLIKNGKHVATFTVRQSTTRQWTPLEIMLMAETAERTWAAVERAKSEESKRENRSQLEEELKYSTLLQILSTVLLPEKDVGAFYDKLLDIASELMDSQFASIQMFYPGRESGGALRLLAHKGFNKEAESFWEWVNFTSGSACGEAMRKTERVIVQDVYNCEFLQGTADLHIMVNTGIRSVQTTPLVSRNGALVGMVSTHWSKPYVPTERQLRFLDMLARQAADTLERKKAEDELKESEQKSLALVKVLEEEDKNKNQFIGVLSHELRNPLAVIVAGLSLLEASEKKEQILKYREIIKRQTNQLCKLVDDLLDLTRISQNKIKLRKETVNLNDILKKAMLAVQLEYNTKSIRLLTELPKEPVVLSADPVRITQCAENLLHNALKFTQEDGNVTFSLTTEKGEAVIRVKDNGIGINSDFLEHIFKPFMQADTSLDRQNNNGLGLGLSIVDGIARLHGGSATVFSEGVGKGSLFTIRLPISIKVADTKNDTAVNENNRTYKILLIENNKNLADVLLPIFNFMGHEAYAAYDGIEGISEAKKIRPDVIFCDIGLPGISGYEVAKVLKADDELKSTCLIALSGYAGEDDIRRTMEVGFNRHLAKPVDMTALERILTEIDSK